MKCGLVLFLTVAVFFSLLVLPAPAQAQYQHDDNLPGEDSGSLMKAILIGAGIGLAVTAIVYLVRHGESHAASADSTDEATLIWPGSERPGCLGDRGEIELRSGISSDTWQTWEPARCGCLISGIMSRPAGPARWSGDASMGPGLWTILPQDLRGVRGFRTLPRCGYAG